MTASARRSTRQQDVARARLHTDYTAAVRYLDGRSELFHIVNADDLADARAMVLAELVDVKTVMLALRQQAA